MFLNEFRAFTIPEHRCISGKLLSQGWPKQNHNHSFPKGFCILCLIKRHLMAHPMTNLCVFSVIHCVEGAFDAASRRTPKLENRAPQYELKNWSLSWLGHPLYSGEIKKCNSHRRRWQEMQEKLPSSQKQLQPKNLKSTILGFWISSLLEHESKSQRKSLPCCTYS